MIGSEVMCLTRLGSGLNVIALLCLLSVPLVTGQTEANETGILSGRSHFV